MCVIMINYLILSRQRLDAGNFAAHAVPPPGGAHVDLRVVLKALMDKQNTKEGEKSFCA